MAMPGMNTQIYEQATKLGTTYGSSANISGTGFARMRFSVRAANNKSFNNWVKRAKASPRQLSLAAYKELAKHNVLKSPVTYSSVQPGLFHYLIIKYMMPGANNMKMKMPMTGSKMPMGKSKMPGMRGGRVNNPVRPLNTCGNVKTTNKEVFLNC
jgi:hypothetical protein